MHPFIEQIEKKYKKSKITAFEPGDTVRVAVKVKEGDKERIQAYEGIVIARRGSSLRETFTVRRVSFGVAVERIFLLHSPIIQSIKLVRKGKVRRAKLFYLRKLAGKKARVQETIMDESMESTAEETIHAQKSENNPEPEPAASV